MNVAIYIYIYTHIAIFKHAYKNKYKENIYGSDLQSLSTYIFYYTSRKKYQ